MINGALVHPPEECGSLDLPIPPATGAVARAYPLCGMTLSGMSDSALWGEIHCPMVPLRAMVQKDDGSRLRRMAEGKGKKMMSVDENLASR